LLDSRILVLIGYKMNELCLSWLNEEKPLNVAIIGDVILDEYLDGSVSRISPEAPVPVHRVSQCSQTPGGAANTARNIQHAGGRALLFSICGDDETAMELEKILTKDQISIDGLIKSTDRPTIKKTRITSNNQQLLRIDRERVHPIHLDQQLALYKKLEQSQFSALLISDYGKGTLPKEFIGKLIKLANSRKVPCIVDPKGKDFDRYQGADMITPNTKEACDALNLDIEENWTGEVLGQKLQEKFGLSSVLVTMGSKGMVLSFKDQKQKPVSVKPNAREVFDVSGAGDTAVAIMTLGLAANMNGEDAMKVANLAAGIVVEKWGTQPVFQKELEEALWSEKSDRSKSVTSSTKIVSKESLRSMLESPALARKKVVFTNGCFDLLHAGHVSYLEKAKAKGQILVIAVNSDDSVKRLKGNARPLIPLQQRQQMLAALGCVDFVVSFSEDTPKEIITYLTPDVLIKGADYKEDEIVGADIVKKSGGSVATIELINGISTSEIIRRAQLDPSFK